MFGFEKSQFTQVMNTSERLVNVLSAEMLERKLRRCGKVPQAAYRSTVSLLIQQGDLLMWKESDNIM